jgi:hypothetical protein
MKVIDFIWYLLTLIPAFWDGVFRFFNDTELPESLRFLNDLIIWLYLTMPTWLVVVLIIAAYLTVCFFAFKLADQVMAGINNHMEQYGGWITDNFKLYVTALVFCCIDAFVGHVTSLGNEATFFVTLFGYAAALVFLIAVIRSLIQFKWRGLYFVPLQLMTFAYLYFYFLVMLPAFICLMGGVAMGSIGDTKVKCASCGCTYDTNKINHCPRCG